jgi:hypothetical protein
MRIFATAITLVLFLSTRVYANQYEVFIDIDAEEDLYDLRAANEISDETLEILVELLQRGIDLNRASRRDLYTLPNLTYKEVDAIMAYRKEVGHIVEPTSLVTSGIISERKLNAIAAFLVVRTGGDGGLPASGMVRLTTRYANEDSGLPASALRMRAQGLRNVTVGLAAMNTRNRLGQVRYDPARQALTADAPRNDARVPKFFVQWENSVAKFLAGTYQIGFGQRLTFDETDQYDPDGFYGDTDVFRNSRLARECKESAGELPQSPCAGTAGDIYITPDFRTRDSLMGVAATIKEIPAGKGSFAVHGFGSYQPRSIYQYELYSPTTCDDPRNDDDPLCSAPHVYRTQQDPLALSSRFSFQTLPNMYAELVGGGHLRYNFGTRSSVGFTGYRSQVDWLVEGMELDFQEWSPMPFGGNFGAVGVDAAHGHGITDFFAEVSRSFDQMKDGGGGLGAIMRSVTAWDKNEIEASVRYYDKDFANPHARPISGPDEFEGLRARDETGARIRYTGRIKKRLNLRTSVDFWRSPAIGTNEILAFVRSDIDMTDRFRWGLWAQYQDKDLGRSGRDECFEVVSEFDENGEPIPCAGQKTQLIGRVRVAPKKTVWIDLQLRHAMLDDQRYDDKMRQDVSFIGIVTAKPHPKLRLRGRTRYRYEDVSDNTYLEQTLWTYGEATYRLRARDRLRLRYDLLVYRDERENTVERRPSPEHWLWLEYEAKF